MLLFITVNSDSLDKFDSYHNVHNNGFADKLINIYIYNTSLYNLIDWIDKARLYKHKKFGFFKKETL